MRQRNIPVTEKVATEVQTDIQLVNDPVYYSTEEILSGSRIWSGLRQSQLRGVEGVVRPHTDSLLLGHLKQQLQLFSGLKSLDGMSQQDLKKRLLWLEHQIQGLEKRQLSLMGGDGAQPGYYTILNELQARLDRQTVIGNNYEPRIQQLTKRIEELEGEVAVLRHSLLTEQNTKDENEALKDVFRQVQDAFRSKQVKTIENTVNTILTPLMDELDFKLEVFLKNTTVVGRAATNPQNRLKTQINLLVRNLDRLVRSHDQLTIENVDGLMQTFLKDMDVYQTFQQYAAGKMFKHLYDDLKEKFTAATTIYQSTFQKVVKDHPGLKDRITIQEMATLAKEDIHTFTSGNVIVLEPLLAGGRTVYYQTLETRTKNLLNLMSRQFRRIVTKYPDLKAQLGTQLYEYLTLEVFDDAVSLEELERIVEVVKFQPEIIKVENVYQYNSDKNLKAIFHLRIMIKALLEELFKIKEKNGLVLEIDEGLLGLIRAEVMDLIDVDDVLRVFRSVPKILEVEKIVEKDLGRYLGILTKGHALNTESAKMVERVVEKPVIVKDQVGIVVEKGTTHVAVHQKAVFLTEQKAVEVPITKEKVVERIVLNERAVEFEVLQEVPIKEIEIQEVEKVVWKERTIEVPVDCKQSIPVETVIVKKEIVEVPRYQERLVEVLREVTNVKEVTVVEQVPVEIVKYIELEKTVNNFVKVPQIVEIKEQVPIVVNNTIDRPVEIIQTIQKIVVEKVVEERIIEVPVRHEVPLIKEVPVPYKEEVMVLVKGDRQEIILEVERITEKPILHEMIKLMNVEVEKAVPVWLREEKPVIVEVSVPYIQTEPEIITLEVEKMVPYREEVPVEVVREVPVPVVVEKEVLKQVRVVVEKVVEKIVEVPRVVEVEKIVERIVVVPRIIDNIVQVPVIVERIVERDVEVLKIVEIEKTVPIYLTNEVKEIVQERIPYPVEKKVVQIAEREKIVVINQEREVIREVEVERRIPVQVIRERDVQVITEKIVQRLLTIHEAQIRDREVVIPFKQEIPIQLIQEKAVEIRKIIENIVQVPQVIDKLVTMYETKIVPEIHTVYKEIPIEVEKEVVYTDTRNVIEKEVVYRDMIKEIIVQLLERHEIIKPEPYIVEKLVFVNEVHEQGIGVHLERGKAYRCDQLVEVAKPVSYFATKQIPHNIYRDKLVEVRTFIDQFKEVEVEGPEKIVQVSVKNPEVIQVTEQVLKYLNQEVEKRVFTEVPIKEDNIKYVDRPGKDVLVHEALETRTHTTEPVYSERIVERVVLLPQIIEILKHVHDISEIHKLGVAVGVDIDVHRRDYLLVCRTLRESLEKIRLSLRGNIQFQAQLALIDELLPLILQLIEFPTIVQVPKEVEKIVEKPVLVPTRDQDAIDREVASTTLIEKLVAELKRLRSKLGIQLELDEDVKNIFFVELKNTDSMDLKLQQFTRVVLERFRSLGNWTSEHSLMLNSFLQQRFLMAGIIKECNDNVEGLKLDLEREEATTHRLNDVITKLNIHNLTLKNALEELLGGLQNAATGDLIGSRGVVEGLLVRVRTLLDSAKSDPLRESRYLHARGETSNEIEKLRAQVRILESEVGSFRGGESRRNGYLATELGTLKAENETLRAEITKLRQGQGQERSGDRRSLELTKKIDELNNQLHLQQGEFDRKYRRAKEDFEKQLQVKLTESRMIPPAEEEERLRHALRDHELRIGELEELLAAAANQNEKIRFELNRKSIENEDFKKKLFDSQMTSEFQPISGIHSSIGRQGTAGYTPQGTPSQPSQMRSSQRPIRESGQGARRSERPTPQPDEPQEGTGEKVTLSQSYQSPDVRGSGKFHTPAEQLKFQSPELREVRTEQEPSEIESSSSRLSGQQLQSSQLRQQPKRNITLRQLLQEGQTSENIIANLIVRIIDKLQEDMNRGRYLLYTPETITLIGYTPDHPEQVKIKLGDPIDRGNAAARVYIPPEVMRGDPANERSSVFNIASIWDELLHSDMYFRSGEDIENPAIEYRVRNNRINSIFKNTMFEMMAKDPKRRIPFGEIKRRLALQQFIGADDSGDQPPRRRP